MIAVWMSYTAAVTLLLYSAAIGAEYVARALRLPTRFAWIFAMTAAVALSGRALLHRADATRPVAATVSGPASIPAATEAPVARRETIVPPPAIVQSVARFEAVERSLDRSVSSIDVSDFDRWNRVLIVAWALGSSLMLSWLAFSLARLQRLASRFAPDTVSGHAVLVSDDLGPALLGVLRTRIVLPRWVLELSPAEQETIVAHEHQHAHVFDPALVCATMCIVALQPWNVVLWMLLARLRLAVEADCDRRVLGGAGDVRAYGQLLVAMYERTSGLSPHVAFAERASNLERRIRRIASRPRLLSAAVCRSALAAMVLAITAWKTPAPTRSSPLVSPASAASAMVASVRAFAPPLSAEVATNPFIAESTHEKPEHAVRLEPSRPESTLPFRQAVVGEPSAPPPAVAQGALPMRMVMQSLKSAPFRLVVPGDTTRRPVIFRGPAIVVFATPTGAPEVFSRTMEITSLDTTSRVHVELKQGDGVIATAEGLYLIFRRDSVGVAIEARSHAPPPSSNGVGGPSRAGIFIDAETAAVVMKDERREGARVGPCATPDSIAIRGLSRLLDADVRSALGVTPRTPISGPVVTQALKNLYATNNFEPNATTTCEIIGGKSVLVFNMTEARSNVPRPSPPAASERVTSIVQPGPTGPPPRYPTQLRAGRTEGHVILEFTVDARGVPDTSSIKVVEETNSLFTDAIRRVLPMWRFQPAGVVHFPVRFMTVETEEKERSGQAVPDYARDPRTVIVVAAR